MEEDNVDEHAHDDHDKRVIGANGLHHELEHDHAKKAGGGAKTRPRGRGLQKMQTALPAGAASRSPRSGAVSGVGVGSGRPQLLTGAAVWCKANKKLKTAATKGILKHQGTNKDGK